MTSMYLSHFQKSQDEVNRLKKRKERKLKKRCAKLVQETFNACEDDVCAMVDYREFEKLYRVERIIPCPLHEIHEIAVEYFRFRRDVDSLTFYLDHQKQGYTMM